MENKPIFVTQPSLPPLDEFVPMLEKIWESKILTNNGPLHQQLEKVLCEYLGVNYISLFANGTLALVTALQALNITGEVITTPYSFVATTHSLWWNNIIPVFVDIDPITMNLDPEKVEAAITSDTKAIMPVHVYGTPCNHKRLKEIADNYNLKLIYDAAHAFGVKENNTSVTSYGDLSVLSFHATKVYNTLEGGAIICHDAKMKQHIDDLKNFGFRGETNVVAPGINAKMNELQSAYGLLALKAVDDSIEKRKRIAKLYEESLEQIDGISFLKRSSDIKHNYGYFPIFVDAEKYGKTRDELYEYLKQHNIFGRRYFYPLISQFPFYRGLPSAAVNNLPNALKIADQVICLPIYPSLEMNDVGKIIHLINSGI